MTLLIDMSLSPRWVEALRKAGFHGVHWSTVGAPNADDEEIFQYARAEAYVILTADLDFGTLLAQTGLEKPSVVQLRLPRIGVDRAAEQTVETLKRFEPEISAGAIVSLDVCGARVRLLPFEE